MKRLLSWLLVLTMLVACLPMSVIPALATETDVDISESDDDFEVGMDELFPGSSVENPKLIEEMNWYSDEVVQLEGDTDGFFYKYVAPADGTITLYFTAVYDDEGNSVDLGTQRDIKVTNNTTEAQYSLLNDGVDNYGLELVVSVAAGDEIIINTAWTVDADGNEYPAATYSWNGNFTYPAGSEKNPINLEWTWDDAYANATASATVAAGETVYYYGQDGMILTVDGVETAQTEGVFSITNSGDAEATYALALATPVGAQNNPEVIENMVGYSDTNSLEADGSYYYIWTATEDGTVTLDVTDGANLTVDKLTYTEDSEWPISTQYALAEPEIDENWNYTGWTVAENLVIEVVTGEQLKIQVNGLTDWSTWTTPAIDYTLTGNFEAITKFGWAGMSVALESSLLANFVMAVTAVDGEDNYAVISKEVYDVTTGEISIESITVPQSEWGTYGARLAVPYSGVAAKMMMDEFTVIVYNGNGQQISEAYTRNIEDYLYATLANTNTADAKKVVCVDFLNYGSAAQDKFNYRPTELANAKLTDAQKALATSDDAINVFVDGRVKGSLLAGTAVAAEFEIIPAFVYAASNITEVAYANVSYTNNKGAAVNYDIPADQFGDYSTTLKKVEITGTAIADGASPITVTLCKADGTVVDTSVDCVSYYAARAKDTHEVFVQLLKLIYSAGVAFA